MGKIRRIDFHPDEFLAGVVGMTPEDIGVYWTLCARMYSAGGPIQNDAEMNAEGFSRKTRPSTIRATIDRLVAAGKLFVCASDGDPLGVGFLYQKRCRDVINSTQSRINDASKSGKKGGRPSSKNNDLEKGSGFGAASDTEKLTINHQPSPSTITNDSPLTPFGGEAANDDVPADQRAPDKGQPRTDIDAAFEEFWAAYPSRGPAANPKKPARQKFERAVKSGADPADLIQAARRYADQMRAAGKDRTEFVAQAVTFLNQERWEQQEPANDSGPPADSSIAAKVGITPLGF
ncbi:DUF1376 domain-containing protein [Azospirillum brasilense]|nr:DUF1376 domain-containing protein [Azospirillum brasilense]